MIIMIGSAAPSISQKAIGRMKKKDNCEYKTPLTRMAAVMNKVIDRVTSPSLHLRMYLPTPGNVYDMSVSESLVNYYSTEPHAEELITGII